MTALAMMALTPREARAQAARRWRPGRDQWRAWHCFLHAPEAQEQLLRETIAPIAGVWQAGGEVEWFFLRYWENGPHLRLRARGLDDGGFVALGETLRSAAARLADGLGPQPERFPAAMRVDGAHSDPASLPWFPAGTVAEIDYEPEVRRYGGRHGLAVSEHWFGASSALALAVIGKTAGEPRLRQSIALRLTVGAIASVAKDEAEFADFLRIMAANWGGYVGDAAAAREAALQAYAPLRPELGAMIRQALQGGAAAAPSPIVSAWRGTVENYVAELLDLADSHLLVDPATGVAVAGAAAARHAIQNILFSQLHMTNNRLGIMPQQEFQFATVLLDAVERS